MALLDLVQNVCNEVGIAEPNSVVGNTDSNIKTMLALVNREGRDLASRYNWEELTKEATFTSVAGEDQGDMETHAPGYRFVVNSTMWDRDSNRKIVGSRSAQDWQRYKSNGITGPWPEFRIRGGKLLFLPEASAGDTIAFEYVTTYWVYASDGTTEKAAFTLDTDVPRLPQDIVEAGLRWRFLKAKGLEYAEDYNTYERLVADATVRDGARQTLDMGRRRNLHGYDINNVWGTEASIVDGGSF